MRDDCDCSTSKALSFLAAALVRPEFDGARYGRRRNDEEVRGVCLEAVKKWGPGECKLEIREGRFGVLKFEMSLKREEGFLYGDGDGHDGGSSPSIARALSENGFGFEFEMQREAGKGDDDGGALHMPGSERT